MEISGKVLEVKNAILDLQQRLLTNHPQIPTLLREIHSHHLKDREVVTLLDEEEISIIVNGLKRQAMMEATVAMIGKKAPSARGKRTASLLPDADEL